MPIYRRTLHGQALILAVFTAALAAPASAQFAPPRKTLMRDAATAKAASDRLVKAQAALKDKRAAYEKAKQAHETLMATLPASVTPALTQSATSVITTSTDLQVAQLEVAAATADVNSAPPDVATWSLLGAGYGQLVNATDSSSAFTLGISYQYRDLSLAFQLQRGNSTNPLTTPKQIGQFLLEPIAGNYALGLAADYRPCSLGVIGAPGAASAGGYVYFNAGTSTWLGSNHAQRPDDTADSLLSYDAVGLAGGLGGSAQLLSLVNDAFVGGKNVNSIAVTARVGLAYRGIAGTVLGAPAFLEHMTSRQVTSFFGGEIQLALQINSITAAIAIPIMAGHLDGLTNGQVVPSLLLGGSIDFTPTTVSNITAPTPST
jgi:hypothetical protein